MPEISVIIVSTHHRDQIHCIPALKNQEYSNYEIIISNKDGISKARNDGIQRAEADKLIFLDDDAYPQPGYLELAVELLNDHPIVAGRVIHPDNDFFMIVANDHAYDQGDEPKMTNDIIGCNMLFQRDVFDNIGTFDEKITWGHDETLFIERAQHQYDIFYHPDLAVEHRFENSIIDWWRKQIQYGPADVYKSKVTGEPLFSGWYEIVPISSGDSFAEITFRSVRKNIRNIARLAALLRGVPDPPENMYRSNSQESK
jgi:GT2 family glycosyltransferase